MSFFIRFCCNTFGLASPLCAIGFFCALLFKLDLATVLKVAGGIAAILALPASSSPLAVAASGHAVDFDSSPPSFLGPDDLFDEGDGLARMPQYMD